MPWVFESGACNTLLKSDGLYVKVEITTQSIAPWFTSPADALTAPDFTTGAVTGSEFIFNVPDIQRVSNLEPGAAGNSSLSLEAMNIYVGTAGGNVVSGNLVVGRVYKVLGYTKVTYNSVEYVAGQYFTALTGVLTYTTSGTGTVERYYGIKDILEVDWKTTDVHVRISTKAASGGTYLVRYWGVVDLRSVEKKIQNYSKPQNTLISFTVDDCLQQLTKRPASVWMDATTGGLKHADWDYTASASYLTFRGTYSYAQQGLQTNYSPGAYPINQVRIENPNDDAGQWIAASGLRYIKIVDIFTAISNWLGYEGSVNDGGTWSDFHSWKFYYNSNSAISPGGETLGYVGIDGLAVISALHNGISYIEHYGFFDPLTSGSFSLKRMGDPLEVLNRICASFGLTYRTRVNASGQRYLEIIEYGKYSATVTMGAAQADRIASYVTKPNDLYTAGVEIVSPGTQIGRSEEASNVSHGSNGTDSLKYDCWFTSTNFLRVPYEFRRKVTETWGAPACDVRGADTDFLCSLYALTDITLKNAAKVYSICAIVPGDNGTYGSDTAYIPEFAEYDAGLSAVVVPKVTSGLYYTYIEAPAMALALYLWSPADVATEPVGFSRPRGESIEIEYIGIDYTALVHPPCKLTSTIEGISKDYVITEIQEKIAEDTIVYKGYSRGV